MLIVIPSCGRSDSGKQITVRNFAEMKSTRPVVLAVPESEVRRYNNNALAIYGDRMDLSIIGVPDIIKGISHTRQWILTDFAKHRSERHILMLDDDMDFCFRPNLGSPALETIKSLVLLETMFDTLEDWLAAGFVHIGISARQGNNHFPTPADYGEDDKPRTYRDVTRMMNAYAYDTVMLQKLKVELGRIPVMEDFDLTLQLLRKGYPNRVSFQFCWNQRGSGKEGGCSSYRTAELQAQAAVKLHQFHPEFVKIVMKKATTKENWVGMKERSDVIVQWQRAYESAKVSKTRTA